MQITGLIKATCLASCLAVLVGCTTSYDTVDLDRTTKGYHIFCSGMPYSASSDCYDRASYICGDAGYTVLKEGDPSYVHTQMAWDLSTHDVLVKCNAQPVSASDAVH